MSTGRPFEALKRCEEEFRKLAAQAAAEGDYDTLNRLGNAARAISEIAREWQAPTGGDLPASRAGRVSLATHPVAATNSSRARGGRVSASRGYPRFTRRGDELVKVGWSKRDRKEYQHRAGPGLLVALSKALLDSSRRRKLFTMDFLERYFAENGIPSYQAYVWLAWLRSAGLVKQHGRQGYSTVKPLTFEKDVETLFAGLPTQES